MSKKRGYSQDEKCQMMLEFLMDKQLPFTSKELEAQVPKAKPAIKFPVIKELLVLLVSEQRIEYDKMGASTYYWCLPSAATQKRKLVRTTLMEENEELKAKKQKLSDEITAAMIGKEGSDERKQKLEMYNQLQQKKANLCKEKARYAEFDPQLIQKIEGDVDIAKDAANRWTDTIFTLQSHCTKQMNIDKKAFMANFELSEDFDHIQ